jgi:transcriptional accessory protein Tex/SPT6
LDERRAAILEGISQQGKLHAALTLWIEAADSTARLETLFAPSADRRRCRTGHHRQPERQCRH